MRCPVCGEKNIEMLDEQSWIVGCWTCEKIVYSRIKRLIGISLKGLYSTDAIILVKELLSKKINLECPKCGSNEVASCKGGTAMITCTWIDFICSNCTYEGRASEFVGNLYDKDKVRGTE
jgi:ssDNA-binding Zn-finger/Zn-ribbon topoisomerase 1